MTQIKPCTYDKDQCLLSCVATTYQNGYHYQTECLRYHTKRGLIVFINTTKSA